MWKVSHLQMIYIMCYNLYLFGDLKQTYNINLTELLKLDKFVRRDMCSLVKCTTHINSRYWNIKHVQFSIWGITDYKYFYTEHRTRNI